MAHTDVQALCPRCHHPHKSLPTHLEDVPLTSSGLLLVNCTPCAIQVFYEEARRTAASTRPAVPRPDEEQAS